jgi:hypothetical protein
LPPPRTLPLLVARKGYIGVNITIVILHFTPRNTSGIISPPPAILHTRFLHKAIHRDTGTPPWIDAHPLAMLSDEAHSSPDPLLSSTDQPRGLPASSVDILLPFLREFFFSLLRAVVSVKSSGLDLIFFDDFSIFHYDFYRFYISATYWSFSFIF